MDQYYKRYKDKLILRDVLAADRTQMANERTLLSYMRTALTLFIAGVSFVKFFDTLILDIFGWIFIPLGFWVGWIGTRRFYKIKEPLDSLMNQTQDDRAESSDNFGSGI